MAARNHPRDWLTVKKSADYCDVTTRTIWNWIAAGRLKANRVGPRLVRIDRAELDRIIRPVAARDAS